MKNKMFLILVVFIVIFSCRREEQKSNIALLPTVEVNSNFEGRWVDKTLDWGPELWFRDTVVVLLHTMQCVSVYPILEKNNSLLTIGWKKDYGCKYHTALDSISAPNLDQKGAFAYLTFVNDTTIIVNYTDSNWLRLINQLESQNNQGDYLGEFYPDTVIRFD